jgi:hypothetical protein
VEGKQFVCPLWNPEWMKRLESIRVVAKLLKGARQNQVAFRECGRKTIGPIRKFVFRAGCFLDFRSAICGMEKSVPKLNGELGGCRPPA